MTEAAGGRLPTLAQERARRAVRVWVGSVIVLLPLLLGGAHVTVNLVLACAMVVAAVVAVWARPPGGALRLGLVGLAALVAVVATAVQLVPLPLGVIEVLSPGAYDALSLAYGDAGGWAPLSMEPAATAHELLKLIACLCAVVVVAENDRDGSNWRWLLMPIAVGGLLVVTTGFVQMLAQVGRPYGAFGGPGHAFPVTLVNPNHAAGFLGFASFAALGWGLAEQRVKGWVLMLGAAWIGIGVLLTLSRGGIVAYVAAMILCFALLGIARRAGGSVRAALLTQVALALALLIAAYLSYSRIVLELWSIGGEQGDVRLQIWEAVPAMLGAFGLLGIGRGAFGAVHTRFVSVPHRVTFSHLENEWLQALVDWGLIFGGLVLVALVVAAWVALRRVRANPSGLVTLAGLFFVAVHNLVDFNLTLTCVLLPAAMLLAALGVSEHPRLQFTIPARAVWIGVVAMAVAIPFAAWKGIAHDAARDTALFRSHIEQTVRGQPVPAAVREIMRRHPSDFLMPLLLAQRALLHGEPGTEALHWINRARFLAPQNAITHRFAGGVLLRVGRHTQALSEYRRAITLDRREVRRSAVEVLEITADPWVVGELAAGDAPARYELATFLANEGRAPEVALFVLEPKGVPSEGAEELLLAARCYRALGELAIAMERARRAEATGYRAPELFIAMSQTLERMGDGPGALEALNRGLHLTPTDRPLAVRRIGLLRAAGDLPRARAAARTLIKRSHGSGQRAEAHWLLGGILAREGRLREAAHEYELAHIAVPDNATYAGGAAAVAIRLGQLDQASSILTQAREAGAKGERLDEVQQRLEAVRRGEE